MVGGSVAAFETRAAGVCLHGQEHRPCRRFGCRAGGQGGQPDRHRCRRADRRRSAELRRPEWRRSRPGARSAARRLCLFEDSRESRPAHARSQLQAGLQVLDAPEGHEHRHAECARTGSVPAGVGGDGADVQRDGRFGTRRGGFDRHPQAARAPVRRRARDARRFRRPRRDGPANGTCILLRAGHRLAVWARRPEAAAPLLAAGAISRCATRRMSPDVPRWCSPWSLAAPTSSSLALGRRWPRGEGLRRVRFSWI
jgi:hypothetical protein